VIIVGLTGGIASGKTTVAAEFRKLGAYVIDADKIAHEIAEIKSPAWQRIVESFGHAILLKNGEINRKKLGGIVFQDDKKRKLLESITHPEILSTINAEIEVESLNGRHRVIIIDAALLFESGLYKKMDKSIVVCSSPRNQLNRLKARDK